MMNLEKKFLTSGLILSLFFVSCGRKANISGRIENAGNKLLELQLNTEPKRALDTLRLDASGKFSFTYDFKKNKAPVFLNLQAAGKPLAALLLEAGEKVVVETDFNQPAGYKVSGSEGSQLLKELNDKYILLSKTTDSLTKALNNAEGDEDKIKAASKILAFTLTKYKQNMIRFLIANNKSYAAYSAIYQVLPNGVNLFGYENDALYFKLLADSLEKRYPHSPYVYRLRDDFNRLVSSGGMQKLIDSAQETSIPDISLPDVTGKTVSLSSLSGKVILLDFWHSNDRTTASNNLELLPLYEKYHSLGFEIYQVSLDENREPWLQAINNQKLPWINVCDFNGVNTYPVRLYNIAKLPANYLFTKDGEIAGKNLFGTTLSDKLKTIFAKND
jgi:peroxiredoxin